MSFNPERPVGMGMLLAVTGPRHEARLLQHVQPSLDPGTLPSSAEPNVAGSATLGLQGEVQSPAPRATRLSNTRHPCRCPRAASASYRPGAKHRETCPPPARASRSCPALRPCGRPTADLDPRPGAGREAVSSRRRPGIAASSALDTGALPRAEPGRNALVEGVVDEVTGLRLNLPGAGVGQGGGAGLRHPRQRRARARRRRRVVGRR